MNTDDELCSNPQYTPVPRRILNTCHIDLPTPSEDIERRLQLLATVADILGINDVSFLRSDASSHSSPFS